MRFVFAFVLLVVSVSAFAGSAFETVDVTRLRADRDRAITARRDGAFTRLYDYNSKLVRSIPVFAKEHGGLTSEPTCNSQDWRCSENGACHPNAPEPWNPYQNLNSINLDSFIQIMNCNVAVNDGWNCILNWWGPDGETQKITYHCNREGYRKDFVIKGSKGSR